MPPTKCTRSGAALRPAGTVTGLAKVCGRTFMLIANDATVKAGAFFPMTAKKVIRAQNIAIENKIPTIYLVDSAGVFLPLQEDVFPDTDDFGRVFRNNAVMSAMGIPQITAIMGMCVAGGAYLPVMCDHILMTEGSDFFSRDPRWCKPRSDKRLPRKISAARKCIRKSAARWIFANPMTMRASHEFARSLTRSARQILRRSVIPRRASRSFSRRKSTESFRAIPASSTTCAKSSRASWTPANLRNTR